MSPEEVGAFNEAADKWRAWSNGSVRIRVSREGATGTLEPVRSDEEVATFDGLCEEAPRAYMMTWGSRLLFVPRRLTGKNRVDAFAHEMGHLLGLGHNNEVGSVMYRDSAKATGEFTALDAQGFQTCHVSRTF
jgi:hypothetical protein